MFTERHAVFVGPGLLPKELRDVLLRRHGELVPAVAVGVPRLLATFDTAVEAERLAGQLSRAALGAVVAGPEQPPPEDAWLLAQALDVAGSEWRVVDAAGRRRHVDPARLVAVTAVDWRTEAGGADRAVLLTGPDFERPVMLRASSLRQSDSASAPGEGLQVLRAFLDDCALSLPATARVRQRRLLEADFLGRGLSGDLLPVALHMVDVVDTQPAVLDKPLRKSTDPFGQAAVVLPSERRLGTSVAWGLWGLSVAQVLVGGWVLVRGGLALGSLEFVPALLGLGLVGLATVRHGWSRWVAVDIYGAANPVPSWPLGDDDRGARPRFRALLLDATVAGLAIAALGGPTRLGVAAPVALGLSVVSLALGAAAVWADRTLPAART